MDDLPATRKVVFVGATNAGKTCLARYIAEGSCDLVNQRGTIGIQKYTFQQDVDSRTYSFDLKDTAGQERYAGIASSYCRDANVVALCFDPSSDKWLEDAERYTNLVQDINPCIPILAIATKSDLWSVEARLDDIETGIEKLGLGQLVVSSAKNGTGVNEVKERLAKLAVSEATETVRTVEVGNRQEGGGKKCDC